MGKLVIPKVIIPVKGGLGNQMFFYAFSLCVKENGLIPLLAWDEFVFTKQHNGVELYNVFNIKIDKIDRFQILFYCKINRSFLPLKIKKIIGRLLKFKYIFYKHLRQSIPYSFEKDIFLNKSRKLYLDGFWQNYMYFDSLRGQLLESFKFRLPIDFSNDKYLKEIQSCQSVSIHIRRGDYLDPVFKELNVINSNNYYNQAIEFVKNKVENPFFFIFTDDIVWAKENFVDRKYIFVEGNAEKNSYLDMYLMSQCSHNIIANSTFSWWGAWLNCNPKKIVISPKMWTDKIYSSEMCPKDWIFIAI